MHTNDDIKRLYALSLTLSLSFVCSVISAASDGWCDAISVPLLTHYGSTGKSLLWVVGVSVLIILGILCISLSAIILMARFFNHGQGRAILAGVLCIFSAVVFIAALAIFMVQYPPDTTYYGYSFGILWVGVIFAIITGIIFFTLEDDEFLK